MAKITVPPDVTRIRIGSGDPVAVDPGQRIDVPGLPETESEWHEGTGPLVPPPWPLPCGGPIVMGSDWLLYTTCDECGLRVDADKDGRMIFPPMNCPRRSHPKPKQE
jgi:hypothetical protein